MQKSPEPSGTDREPLILTTDPEEVMWNSLIFASVAAALAFLLTHGFH